MRILAAWVTDPAPAAVMAALGQAYFVGGCVRNALMGKAISDIDIATPLTPDQVTARLDAAGIRSVPTGLQHGTVTAVHDGIGIEVTAFRDDIQTDGRHAVVRFTTDIAVDAGRRDFTMNALYATADGTVVDPLGGLADLQARRVRFIGVAHDRITEDYLRILRFFRFHAWYGAEGIDPDGLAACAELADGLDGLARERVGWEFRKLLAAPDPAPALAAMAASGVLARCLPGAAPDAIAPMVHWEDQLTLQPDWIARLTALGGNNLIQRLRLSRTEGSRLDAVSAALAEPGPPARTAFLHGRDSALAAGLVVAASTGTAPPADLVAQVDRGAAQVFPLKAGDLMRAGVPAGPELGQTLKLAQAAWLDSDFSLTKAQLIAGIIDQP